MRRVERLYYTYTEAALEDELTYLLSCKNEAEIIYDENENPHILIYHPYLNQAEGLLYKININDPLPEFVIWEEDVPLGLVKALEQLGKIKMKRVITDAVRRVYESVDPEYYHVNSILGKVQWRFDE